MSHGTQRRDAELLPANWLDRLGALPATIRADQLSRFLPPASGGKQAAVLMLFGIGAGGEPDVLLTQRASTLRSHAGEVSFPGGGVDAGDDGPVGAALREAVEETGLHAGGVDVLGELPALYLPPSGYVVTPVLAWWRRPSAVTAVNAAEVARVVRVPLADLLDAANRCTARHPSGYLGPAFTVHGLFVWGFTAGLLARVLALAGLERPWPQDRVLALPDDVAALL